MWTDVAASKIRGILGTAEFGVFRGKQPSRVQQKVKLEKAHGNQIVEDQLSDNEESRLCPREGVSGGAGNLIGCAWNGLGLETRVGEQLRKSCGRAAGV